MLHVIQFSFINFWFMKEEFSLLPYDVHSFVLNFWAYKYNQRAEVGAISHLTISGSTPGQQLTKLSKANCNHGARMIKFIIF